MAAVELGEKVPRPISIHHHRSRRTRWEAFFGHGGGVHTDTSCVSRTQDVSVYTPSRCLKKASQRVRLERWWCIDIGCVKVLTTFKVEHLRHLKSRINEFIQACASDAGASQQVGGVATQVRPPDSGTNEQRHRSEAMVAGVCGQAVDVIDGRVVVLNDRWGVPELTALSHPLLDVPVTCDGFHTKLDHFVRSHLSHEVKVNGYAVLVWAK